jgi:hypothetical protein
VFRILALKEIMRNPEKYGFSLADQELAILPEAAMKKTHKDHRQLSCHGMYNG